MYDDVVANDVTDKHNDMTMTNEHYNVDMHYIIIT